MNEWTGSETQRVATIESRVPDAEGRFDVFVGGYRERWTLQRIREHVQRGGELIEPQCPSRMPQGRVRCEYLPNHVGEHGTLNGEWSWPNRTKPTRGARQ